MGPESPLYIECGIYIYLERVSAQAGMFARIPEYEEGGLDEMP